MNKEVVTYVSEKAHELMNAASCSKEAKEATQQWLEAIGTDREKEQTALFIKELEEDIVTVDGLIAFASSPAGVSHFGEELANNVYQHGQELKKNGAQYCDCPACLAALAILEKKEELLK